MNEAAYMQLCDKVALVSRIEKLRLHTWTYVQDLSNYSPLAEIWRFWESAPLKIMPGVEGHRCLCGILVQTIPGDAGFGDRFVSSLNVFDR